MDEGKPNESNDNRNKVSVWVEYWRELLIVVFGFAAVNAIFISRAFRQSTTVDPAAAAQLGSFVGGYVGSMFALVGVVLLFATLRIQRHGLQAQRNAFEVQRGALEVQSFENKCIELLKMHRDNVAEIDLDGARGRKFFVVLVREFRSALDIVRSVAKSLGLALEMSRLREAAYYSIFYGLGPNSSRMLRTSLSGFSDEFKAALEGALRNSQEAVAVARKFTFVPFEGHQSRLGHYYRHLYQLVQYVDQQPFDQQTKYSYVKTIRAQLSTHEQAMLLLNSLTSIGQNWWNHDLILRYHLVKNIPLDFFLADEVDMNTFPAGYFEWEETS